MQKTLFAALALVIAPCSLAAAASPEARPNTTRPVILAANGCGPGFFRTMAGECVPNRRVVVGPHHQSVVLPPPCPRGFLRDPDPARPLCYPVF